MLRVGPEELLRAVDGEALGKYAGNLIAPNTDALEARPHVFLEGQQLAVGVLRQFVCQMTVPEGRHLYAEPAPEGMVPFTMTLDPQPNLVTRGLIQPTSETHTVTGTGEMIQVHSGRVELRLPITANRQITAATGSAALDLTGEVCWQTCDDAVCDAPRRLRFKLSVPVKGPVANGFMTKPGNARVRAMNDMKHFRKMSSRRQS